MQLSVPIPQLRGAKQAEPEVAHGDRYRARRRRLLSVVFVWVSPLVPDGDASGAQVIRGVVTDSASLTPLAAVLVTLADDSRRDLQRALVDARGEFVFRVPLPGRYSLRAERIGMTARTFDRIEVAARDTVWLRIVLAQRPIALESLRATGEGRCELSEDLGLATFSVWNEARKALAVADFASSAGAWTYELERHVRELEPGTLRIRTAARTQWIAASERPMESLPAQDLVDGGWVVRRDGGDRYFAPDAQVLLSDEFLDSHCMQLRPRHRSHPHLVGLEFRPIRVRSRHARIQGVLWLSRETGGLEWLEFEYLDLPGPAEEVRDEQIGGRVDFLRLPDGNWIVSKWYIRMPLVAEEGTTIDLRRLGGLIDFRRPRLRGIAEEGGRVIAVRERATGRLAFADRGGVIAGQVAGTDFGDATERGGRVAIAGAGVVADVDSRGRFAIAGLPDGVYRLAHLRPSLRGLDRDHVLVDVVVRGGDTTAVALRPADPGAVLARACGLEEWTSETGVVHGYVALEESGSAAAGVAVTARWMDFSGRGLSRLRAREMHSAAETDAAGAFRLCGVAADHRTVTVTATTDSGREATVRLSLSDDEPVAVVVLQLPGPNPESGARRSSTSRPIIPTAAD